MKPHLFDTREFENSYFYDGELGSLYTKNSTTFKIWAPTASIVKVVFYEDGISGKIFKEAIMEKGLKGVFTYIEEGDLNGRFYNYIININGIENEATDLYARAVSVNGIRSMVIDLEQTNPKDWERDKRPSLKSPTDAIIYELHIRDLSTHDTANISNVGKFLGLTEEGTKTKDGILTGLDSIKELGVTHVHLLPSFDYQSIDEANLHENKFNWGYDPQNFNVPEGSYSTDPYCGYTRIKEFKEMVKTLHKNNIGVVMDVVYNHTFKTDESSFTKTVPFYYYRTDEKGNYTNGSGTGNETASERLMVNKYIVDSVKYWAKEYHIDGFRFDLMGLHDIKLMEDVRSALDEIDKSIIVYGEGWEAGGSPLQKNKAALKSNAQLLSDRIAFFNDDIRDAIKGHVFEVKEKGYINGNFKTKEGVKFGIVGGIDHPQLDYKELNFNKAWAKAPTQTVTYASCHDNYTLWDKLKISTQESDDRLVKMNKLSAAIVITSQGIPFFQAGEEFARTKNGVENSYESPDSINQLNWHNKAKYNNLFNYYKGLILLRKNYNEFRMTNAKDIVNKLKFFNTKPEIISYSISNKIIVILNASKEDNLVEINNGNWILVVNGESAGIEELKNIKGNVVNLPGQTAYILISKERFQI